MLSQAGPRPAQRPARGRGPRPCCTIPGNPVIRKSPILLLLLAALPGFARAPAAAGAEAPAVARPILAGETASAEGGVVFFLRTGRGGGVAAVGAAHSLPLERVVKAGGIALDLPRSGRPVAMARGFLAPPGRPYGSAGASFADDFHVYALAAPPDGVRALELASGPVRPGASVLLLGIPAAGPADELALPGIVAGVTALRLEVDLDERRDLSGWGGAPVVSAESGRVVGILQAVRTRSGGLTLVAGPVDRLAAALRAPLERGAGRPFAAFADLAAVRRPPETLREEGPLLRQAPEAPGVRVRIEYPPDGASVADAGCGAFVAGTASPADLRRFDVVFAIDTSHSTFAGTGADINGNGIVGAPAGGPVGGLLNVDHTDPGDTVLAAEVAAARVLLADLDPRSTRAGVVTFSGQDQNAMVGLWDGLARAFGDNHQHARTLKPLTADYAQIESALDEVLSLTPVGQTHIAAGLDQAISELLGLRGALSRKDPRSEKVVFLFTDGRPTLPYPGRESANVRVVLDAADRAARASIHVHSFAIGPDALEGPITTVEMAARTGGYFTPIRRPADLADAVQAVDFPKLRDLFLGNETTKSTAEPFRVDGSGAWAGFVPVGPGQNRIRVRARADDGTETVRELSLHHDAGAAEAPIPKELAPRRNLLLEDCLRDLRGRRAEAERLRDEQLRKRLRLEIERERTRARERAAEQRRELELEVEER